MPEQDEQPGAPVPQQGEADVRRKEPALPERIGPYRIVRKLGAGGMGAVFEGLNESIERRVAIKILHSRYSHDPDTAMRFINEARAVNRIDHPGVVQVSDHGQLADGSAYIVMELLQGETLSTRLHRSGVLPVGECVDLVAQVAASLTAAHERGIIHRDLKPDNIMIVADRQMAAGERTKILDFGIAKLAQSEERTNIKTQTNAMLGTPFYMSPEQAQGSRKVDEKTDVYSLGIILYEMLSGKPPFDGEGLGELIVKHMHEPTPPLAARAPGCPPELVQLTHRMLEKDRGKRPSMVEVVELLESMRENHPRPRRRLSQSLPLVRVAQVTAEQPVRPSTLGRAAGQALARTPRRLLFLVAGSAVMVVLVLGLLRSGQNRASRLPDSALGLREPPAAPLPTPPPDAGLAGTRDVTSGRSAAGSDQSPNGPGTGAAPTGAPIPFAPTGAGSVSGSEPRGKKGPRGTGKKPRPGKPTSVRAHIEE